MGISPGSPRGEYSQAPAETRHASITTRASGDVGLQALLCSIHTGSQAVQQGDGSYVHLPLTRRDLALARRDGASTAHKRCSSLMGATLQGLESHRTTIPVLWITSAQHGAVPKETRPGKRLISCAPS